MKPCDYSNYGLAQEILRLKTHAPEIMSEAARRLQALAAQPRTQAEPTPLPGDLVIKALLAMDAEARKRGEMYPQTADEQDADTRAVRKVVASLEFYASERQRGRNGGPSIKDWPTLAAQPRTPAEPNGNWQKFAKEGESAEDVIVRERKDNDALCTLLAQARSHRAEPVTDEEIIRVWDGVKPQQDPSGRKFAVAFARAIWDMRATPTPSQQAAPTPATQTDREREALVDLIADHLSDAYHCTRVWDAWRVGTMSQDDFQSVSESDTPTELADRIIAARAAIPATEGGAA